MRGLTRMPLSLAMMLEIKNVWVRPRTYICLSCERQSGQIAARKISPGAAKD